MKQSSRGEIKAGRAGAAAQEEELGVPRSAEPGRTLLLTRAGTALARKGEKRSPLPRAAAA